MSAAKKSKPPFFVLSCARSGSTSLANILNTAVNGVCAIEPMPNLSREMREMLEGRLDNPLAALEQAVLPRVRSGMSDHGVYGEKNVTYGPFIPFLYDALGAKFVFIKRDGRDVVKSLINWHEQKFGNIYRECREPGTLAPAAVAAAAQLPVHKDLADYARPRPLKSDPVYQEWLGLSRFEMCAWYWAYINNLYLDQLEKLPKDSWMTIDYTGVTAGHIRGVFDFLDLEGFEASSVEALLERRINSTEDRGAGTGIFPDWKQWDSLQREQFERLAGSAMRRLGYVDNRPLWEPAGYGTCWLEMPGDPVDFYSQIYASREKVHKELVAWVCGKNMQNDRIDSVADFGCGIGYGYCDDFADLRYVGIDLNEKSIEWACENRGNPDHAYLCRDFVADALPEQFDLVFSSGTIDNTYDIDLYVAAMVKSAKKWIYITAYRGWFSELAEHRYAFSNEDGCFYNDVSPRRIRNTLESLGCSDIDISRVVSGKSDIPYETRIIARVPAREGNA